MTKNDYKHRGVRYLGLNSYDFGEMLYKFMNKGSCSVFIVSRVAFCHPTYKGKEFNKIVIRCHSESECMAYLTDNVSTNMEKGLKTYNFKQTTIDKAALEVKAYKSTVLVDLCREKTNRELGRRVIHLAV